MQFMLQNYVISGEIKMHKDEKTSQNLFSPIKFQCLFSKMTFACLSQATAVSKRVFHRPQNTIDRIQNTFITNEIHDQGKNIYIYRIKPKQLRPKIAKIPLCFMTDIKERICELLLSCL